MPLTNKQSESSYTKRQRNRAEAIIAATGCYSAEFRNEVQQALNTDPSRLPGLFRQADEEDQKLATAGRSIRAEYRRAGIPLGNPDITGRERPLNRSRKNTTLRLAAEIEFLFVEHENDRLDENTADRATLISDILYDISNETQISGTHPSLVKNYVLAIFDKLNELDQHDYETVQRAFAAIRDLMSGSLCSEARFEEIDREWNAFLYKDDEKRTAKTPTSEEGVSADHEPSPALLSAQDKLAKLENLPENEAVTFQLESEIYRLEHEAENSAEWPDVIDGGAR